MVDVHNHAINPLPSDRSKQKFILVIMTPKIGIQKDIANGKIHTFFSLSSKATIPEIRMIIDNAYRWDKFFDGLVTSVRESEDNTPTKKTLHMNVSTPIIDIAWDMTTSFSIQENENGLLITGNSKYGEDWPETSFKIEINTSNKLGRSTHIQLHSECEIFDIPVPLSSLELMLKSLKPTIKTSIHKAIKQLYNED